MMKALKFISIVAMLHTVPCHAQLYNGYEITPWNLMEFTGGVGLQGTYGTTTIESDFGLLNKVERSAYSGIANFDSKSYIWHPDLVVFDIGASYNPSVNKLAQIVRPDYAVELNRKSVDVSALFLRQKRLSFSTRANLSESFVNIENITNTKTNNTNFGGSIRYVNNFAPVNIGYDVRKSKVVYSNSDRVLDQKGSTLQFQSSKSWKWYARTNLEAVHRNDDNSYFSDRPYITVTDRITLTNDINFTRGRRYTLFSRINYFNQKINSNYNRLGFYERLNISLSDEMRWVTTSNYAIIGSNNNKKQKQFTINSNVSYQLYRSLLTRALASYTNAKSSFIKQNQYNYGISTRYTKKIPLDGTLRLNYTYNKRINKTNGLSNIIEVINEEHTLSDSEVILLANPNIFRNTIVVKDNTGTLVYDENIDYVLYETGNFIEIQRLPGGLITDNSKVLVSYSSNQNSDYSINSNSNVFSAGVNLFKGILNFNYNYSNQSFDNSSIIDYEAENYFKRTSFDGSVHYNFFDGSVQYEKYESELVPYERLSYNLNLHGTYGQHILYSLNYSVNDYSVIQEDGRSENRAYLTGMFAYTFNRNNKLNFMLGYNKRTVNDIGGNWLSGKLTYLKSIGQLNIAASVNFYETLSDFLKSEFLGANISIIRNF